MKACVCFPQRMLNALLCLRNPHKDRLYTIKKLEGMDKEVKCYAIPRRTHAQVGFLLKEWHLQFAAGFG